MLLNHCGTALRPIDKELEGLRGVRRNPNLLNTDTNRNRRRKAMSGWAAQAHVQLLFMLFF